LSLTDGDLRHTCSTSLVGRWHRPCRTLRCCLVFLSPETLSGPAWYLLRGWRILRNVLQVLPPRLILKISMSTHSRKALPSHGSYSFRYNFVQNDVLMYFMALKYLNVRTLLQPDLLAADADEYSVTRSLEAYLLWLFGYIIFNNSHGHCVDRVLLPYAQEIADADEDAIPL